MLRSNHEIEQFICIHLLTGFLNPTQLRTSVMRSNHEIEQQADAQATIFAAYQARLKARTLPPCGPSREQP